MSVKILGIWSSLGNKKISEEEICTLAGVDRWFLEVRTELKNVFYAEKNQWTVEDMFIESILQSLIEARLTVDKIDGIFLSHSGSHGEKIISLSSLIATRLGMNKKKWFIAKDINAACVGFWDALDTAFKQLHSDGFFKHRNYIVAAWDNLGSGQRELTDIKTGMFSDGAASMIISNNPNAYSEMRIIKTWSGISQGVDYTNVKAISQVEGEKMIMHDGKKLSSSLLGTADEIFSLLWIKKLRWNTLIIPHQPNGKMITKRSDSSVIISQAREKWHDIQVHKETYAEMGNLSGASVLFWLERVLKNWLIEKWCKRIILAPFGAGWHIAGAEIMYTWAKWWMFEEEYNNLCAVCEKINRYLYDQSAPLSYKAFTVWNAIPDIHNGVSWFIPTKVTFDKIISTVDVFHRQALKYQMPDKEFVTKSIYYEFPKNDDSERVPTFYYNDKLIAGRLEVNEPIKLIWKTKSGKDIRQVVTYKDWVKIVSEFCEIPPVIDALQKDNEMTHSTVENNNVIDRHQVNVHGSIWGYVSSFLLKCWLYLESAQIDFLWGWEIWDSISVQTLDSLWVNRQIPKKYSNLPWDTKILYNETKQSPICITYIQKSNYDHISNTTSFIENYTNAYLLAWFPG